MISLSFLQGVCIPIPCPSIRQIRSMGSRFQEALLAIFKLIDADSSGSISKLELIGAVYRDLGNEDWLVVTGTF